MIGAKVIGDDAVRIRLDKLAQVLDSSVVFAVLKTSSQVLVEKMRELAPRSERGGRSKQYASRRHPPGYLKASIGIVKGKGKEYPTVWVRPRFTAGFDPWYAHFPMKGTKKMTKAPNPFVDKAWSSTGEQVKSNVTNLINSILEQAVK